MTSGDTEAAATPLQELLDERQRYEGWIRTLEQREGATSPNVYRRVHGDYTLRLERVLQRLSERTEQLRSAAQALETRLATLREREADRIDARQEGELRAAVGEYDEEHWARLREEADREIAEIADERRSVEAELARMERIIDSATRVTPTDGKAGEQGGDGVEATRDASTSLPSPAASSPFSQAGEGVAPSVPAPSVSAAPVNVSRAPEQPAPFAHGFSAGVGAQAPARSAPPQEAGATQRVPSATVQQDNPSPKGAPAPPFTVPPTHPPAPQEFAGEPRREQEKTLKCPECGTMNYATEWYCEHCGGELATF